MEYVGITGICRDYGNMSGLREYVGITGFIPYSINPLTKQFDCSL